MSDDNPKLTFAQYMASKETLRSAVDSAPQRVVEYRVQKYCKLSVGLTKEERAHVKLNPNHTILVDWLYEDVDNPTPLNIRFEGPEIVTDGDHDANWSGDRLLKWLMKNTQET
jgi:hypothetical protein